MGIAATADGGGYYLVTSTGAVYAFGDAKYQGGANTWPTSSPDRRASAVDSATGGYWEAGSDGGIYAYGAPFEGSAGGTTLNEPVVGIAARWFGLLPGGLRRWGVGLQRPVPRLHGWQAPERPDGGDGSGWVAADPETGN